MILDILNSNLVAQRRQWSTPTPGAWSFQNTFGNIKEEIGGAFLPVLEDLAKALTETFEGQGNAVTAFANGLKDAIHEIRVRWAELVLQFCTVGVILNFLNGVAASFANFWVNAIEGGAGFTSVGGTVITGRGHHQATLPRRLTTAHRPP